jgi:RNA polymerase sigma-70 factor (ECF subfamily)
MLLPPILAVHAAAGDADLVRRLQRRDPRALGELYDRYGRIVFSLILRMVPNAALAEDLVQETFLRVWSRAGAVDAEHGAPGPWLLAVARNRAIDYLRSTSGGEGRAIEAEEADRPSLYRDMEVEILGFDRARRVRAALARLSPEQRQAIELACFEGLAPSGIAERMGQPPGAVRNWLRTGFQNLRDDLGGAVSA